jgi:hypothetical protein
MLALAHSTTQLIYHTIRPDHYFKLDYIQHLQQPKVAVTKRNTFFHLERRYALSLYQLHSPDEIAAIFSSSVTNIGTDILLRAYSKNSAVNPGFL